MILVMVGSGVSDSNLMAACPLDTRMLKSVPVNKSFSPLKLYIQRHN